MNASKSACMRIGARHKIKAQSITVESAPIPWKTEIHYLGVNFVFYYTLKNSLQPPKQKFFEAGNYIFGIIGTKTSLSLLLSLISSFCVPN